MSAQQVLIEEEVAGAGFDVERLVESFPVLVEAEGGGELLRNLVLDLGVLGFLSESPARPRMPNDDKPALPSDWTWSTLGALARMEIGRTPSTKNVSYWDSAGLPWVSIADMPPGGTLTQTAKSVSQRAADEVFRGRLVPAGTLLMSFKLTLGKVCILGMDAFHNEAIISIYPSPAVTQEFLFRFLPRLALGGGSKNAIKGATLNRSSLDALPIPVPPLAEQKRIVAKVDGLTRLIDELEAKQAKKLEVQAKLRTAALDALAKAEGPEEVAAAWERVEGNFETLCERAERVGEVRQAILGLAIRGLLVPQSETEGASPQSPQEIAFNHSVPTSWHLWPLRSVFTPLSTQGKKVLTSAVKNQGKYPVVDQGQQMIRGYVDDEAIVIQPPRPVIVFGDHTREVKFVDFPFVAGADGTKILIPREFVDAKYLFVFLKACRIESRGYGRHYARLLELAMPVPPLAEQKRIVAKADALMKLCDDLEAKLKAKEEAAARLAKAVVKSVIDEAK